MKKEDAIGLAKTVETIFKGKKEVEDMNIDKYQRALLYELQKENLLKLRREEMKEKGKNLRKYYCGPFCRAGSCRCATPWG
ncbi:MAG: hypothetical protein R6U46_00835 [Marinilabilia sp.]